MSGLDRDGLREVVAEAEKMDAAGPGAFRTGQDHLPPAFREVNWNAAFQALAKISTPALDALPALLDTADAHDRLVAALRGMRDEWDNEARQAWSDADRINCGDVIADQISRRAERLRALLAEHGEATP